MVIPVPPKDSFDVEAGRYAAKCIDVRERSPLERKNSNKRLRIVWEGADDGVPRPVHMTGPAMTVFDGEIELDDL